MARASTSFHWATIRAVTDLVFLKWFMLAWRRLQTTVPVLSCSWYWSNVTQKNVFGPHTPDGASKSMYLTQIEDGSMRAPIMLDVHNWKKTIAMSLDSFRSTWKIRLLIMSFVSCLQEEEEQYLCGLCCSYGAKAIKVRSRGMTQLICRDVFVQNSRSGRLLNQCSPKLHLCHLPAVPPDNLALADPLPNIITIPGAELLWNVVDETGEAILLAVGGGPNVVINLQLLGRAFVSISCNDSDCDSDSEQQGTQTRERTTAPVRVGRLPLRVSGCNFYR